MSKTSEANLSRNFCAVPKSLRILASNPGWIDQDIVTIRKMNRAGHSVQEIADALGWTYQRTRNRMKRDGIGSDKRKTGSRDGAAISARVTAFHREHGRGLWHDKAIELKASGLKPRQIAAILGFPPHKISEFFSRRRIADLYPRERRSA